MRSKKVYGIGINDYDGKTFIGNKRIKSYTVWKNMLLRCYNHKFQEKQPTYIGCSVCKEWLNFSNFKKWFDENYPKKLAIETGFSFDLDKDLLSKGNKIYSPKTCTFLPRKINSFLAYKKHNNTSGYVGVTWHKKNNKWVSHIQDFDTHKVKYIGCFENLEDAGKSYKLARELEAMKAKEYMRNLGYSEEIINKIE